jgi:hypothetical protein
MCQVHKMNPLWRRTVYLLASSISEITVHICPKFWYCESLQSRSEALWDQNAGQSHNIKIDNTSFERVEQFKYLVTTLTDRNPIQEEIKSRLKPGNACYHSVQDLLSSSLLSKNTKIKINRTIICLLFCMGVKLGLSHWGRNMGWGCSRIGCWGGYLGLKGTR